MRYKKVVVSIFVMLLVASAGCISSHSPVIEKQELKEVMGGRYNGSLWLYSYGDYETTRIHFTVDEKTYVGYPWNESYIPALDWIKNNTPKDAEFLCWWDYGGMIMGYTERNVVAYAASKKLKEVVAGWDEEGWEEKKLPLSDEIITDVSTALITNDSTQTKEFMEKYNAEYVFVTKWDVEEGIFGAINIGAYGTEKVHVGSDESHKTILVRLWSEDNVQGFENVYSDDTVKIYRIIYPQENT